MGFSSVPRLPGWSFQQLIHGGALPPPHCPDMSGPAVSPTDKLRKNSALTPVTSERSTLFSWVTEIVRLSSSGLPAGRQAGFKVSPDLSGGNLGILNLSSYLCLVYSLYKKSLPFNGKKDIHGLCDVFE